VKKKLYLANEQDYKVINEDLFEKQITAGIKDRKVYLPKGTSWRNFWTGQTYQGGRTLCRIIIKIQ
jgi:alpha-D-xyloside xylohydrolase